MMDKCKDKYSEEFHNIHKFVQGDDGKTYNHHTHAHINLGRVINWNFDIKNFIRGNNE